MMPAGGPALLGREGGEGEESRSREGGGEEAGGGGEPQLLEAVATASTALLSK